MHFQSVFNRHNILCKRTGCRLQFTAALLQISFCLSLSVPKQIAYLSFLSSLHFFKFASFGKLLSLFFLLINVWGLGLDMENFLNWNQFHCLKNKYSNKTIILALQVISAYYFQSWLVFSCCNMKHVFFTVFASKP